MIFAFLFSALLFSAGLLCLLGGSVILLMRLPIPTYWGELLLIASFILMVVASLAANKRYKRTMKLCSQSYDQWAAEQRRIASRSAGIFKITVLLNMIPGICAYEKIADGHRILTEIQPLVEKRTDTYSKFCYLMQVLAIKEKQHDLSYARELLTEAWNYLNNADISNRKLKQQYIEQYHYARTELDFYCRASRFSSPEDRLLAEKLNTDAKQLLQNLKGVSFDIGYAPLTFYYNIGLTAVFLGRPKEAQEAFDTIVRAPYAFSLIHRVRQYQQTGDISILLSMIP